MDDLTRRGALAAIGTALWAWPSAEQRSLPTVAAGFTLPLPAAADAAPLFASRFIDHDPAVPYVHCPSICERVDGGFVCAWYAGPREGHREVAVWLAEAEPQADGTTSAWTTPRAVVNRRTAIEDLDRFVHKVGNSVVFKDSTGRLWLVYVTIAVGGWSGSSLNATSSVDGGRTWSPSRRLTLSPLFNISELVRAAPVQLESGEIGLPVYHECLGKFPEIVWLRPDGDRLAAVKSRLAGGRSFLQPSVVPSSPQHAIAYLRDHSRARRLTMQRTTDGGRTWSEPEATSLPNGDSSIAAVRLSSGGVLLAFNSSPHSRETMSLALSPNGIDDWRIIEQLDHEPDGKFAYPFMIQDSRGFVHLVFSWQMKRLRHVVMNEAWIRSRMVEPPA